MLYVRRLPWSEKAWATYQADRKIRQNWQKRCEERRAGR